ncbi:MAG: SidJ-related pseudokinase [Desulfohalobiaceae bacterium]
MSPSERDQLLPLLQGRDFTACFLAAHGLSSAIKNNPELAGPETVSALSRFLKRRPHSDQSKAFFLYRTAAEGLCAALTGEGTHPVDHMAKQELEDILCCTEGTVLRAVSEATGALPLHLAAHVPLLPETPELTKLPGLAEVLQNHCLRPNGKPDRKGRSLVFQQGRTALLVLKCARNEREASGLFREAFWMEFLRRSAGSFPADFDIPVPLTSESSWLCRATGVHVPGKDGQLLDQACAVLAYQAPAGYFSYPNDPGADQEERQCSLSGCLARNARLLGHLAGKGIVHTAPIPLFHNRVQQQRRQDQGVYQWHRGGRLDQWLSSTRYPNFAATGLRDFEHFETLCHGGPSLFRTIGSHLLSLVLVCASSFRNKEPKLKGLDNLGRPVDARHLFDPDLLATLIVSSFESYASGFLGKQHRLALPFDLERLVDRVIDEMGVDRYMHEVLRVRDQLSMDMDSFRSFLGDRGLSRFESGRLRRGAADIPIISGPHLGGFNQAISIPELVEAVAATAATCVLNRFMGAKMSGLHAGLCPPAADF